MMPIIIIEDSAIINFEGKKRKLVYLYDNKPNVVIGHKSIIITGEKNIHKKYYKVFNLNIIILYKNYASTF